MHQMSSFNPYIFKAFYNWLTDNEVTPHLLVNAEVKGVQVPREFVKNHMIVLSITPAAIRNLEIDEHVISFCTRFKGHEEFIVIPYAAMQDLIGVETQTSYPLSMLLDPSEDESEMQEQENNPFVAVAPSADSAGASAKDKPEEEEGITPAFSVVKPKP